MRTWVWVFEDEWPAQYCCRQMPAPRTWSAPWLKGSIVDSLTLVLLQSEATALKPWQAGRSRVFLEFHKTFQLSSVSSGGRDFMETYARQRPTEHPDPEAAELG